MLKKVEALVRKDELLLHKIGLALGTIAGVVLGMIVSESADNYEQIESVISDEPVIQQEETIDGPSETD